MRNFIGFWIYGLCYFIVQNCVLLTIYFAVIANLNPGVITTIWSVTPFFIAVFDFFMFGVVLQCYHYIGIIFIFLGTLLLSLMKFIVPQPEAAVSEALVETWVPVIMGVITPIFFTFQAMWLKHLVQERINF